MGENRRSVTFRVEGTPKTRGSKRAFVAGKRAIMRDSCESSGEWMDRVASAARREVGDDFDLFEGPVSASFAFFFQRPKGHYGTGRNAQRIKASAPSRPTGKNVGDVSKLVRAVEDALTGIVYRDDSLIVDESSSKTYGPPCVLITVSELKGGAS